MNEHKVLELAERHDVPDDNSARKDERFRRRKVPRLAPEVLVFDDEDTHTNRGAELCCDVCSSGSRAQLDPFRR
jgi:hypothetical protein